MYSIVVMAALTSGGEVADYHCRSYGCYSGCYSSCYSYCSPCYSYCSPCYSYCYRPCYSYCYTPCYTYYPCGPIMVAPAKPAEKEKKKKTGGDDGEVGSIEGPAPATIVVNLPEQAKLTVDGSPTTSTSSRRVFVSTQLEPGMSYHYVFKATVMQDGKPVATEQKVTVRAGEQTEVTIKVPQESVAAR